MLKYERFSLKTHEECIQSIFSFYFIIILIKYLFDLDKSSAVDVSFCEICGVVYRTK